MTWDRASGTKADTGSLNAARALRHQMTDAERRLWWALRHDMPPGTGRFRRQVPIGRYIVDFMSLKGRLVVEVDGEQHGFDLERRHDLRRDDYLRSQDFRVMRFW